MKKFVYVTIDNRPCNNLFPLQLAKLQNIELITPPDDIMDDFRTPTNYEALDSWLFDTCDDNTVLVLSVDNFVFGSLLNSRQNTVSIEESLRRIERVKELKRKNKGMKIYAFSVLMRTSISTFNQAGIENWKLVNEYSQVCHKAELFGKKEDIERLEELKRLIPTDILTIFLDARERNHLINKHCIEMVHENIFEMALILQEDSTPYGVHKLEQKDLTELLEKYNLFDKVSIHNGTDEAGCIAVAKAIADYKNIKTKLSFKYLNDNRDTFIASYEDRLFHENLVSHSKAVGIDLSEDDDCENVLFVYTPVDKQYEASFGDGTPPCDYTEEQLMEFGKAVAKELENGKRVFFLDVAYANGGQGDILRKINHYFDITKLSGYSAWNTASNALGTILAQIVMAQEESKANTAFTVERLLDDYAYQGVVRKRLEYKLRAKGEETLNLSNKAEAEEELQQIFDDFLKTEELFKNHEIKAKITLPWPRIFECKVLVNEIN